MKDFTIRVIFGILLFMVAAEVIFNTQTILAHVAECVCDEDERN